MGSGISSTCQTSKSTEVRNSLRSLRDPDTRRSGRKTALVGNKAIRISPRKENVSTNTRQSNRKIGIGIGSVNSKHINDKNNNSNTIDDRGNNVENAGQIRRQGVLRSNSWVGNGIDRGSANELNTILSDSCDSGIDEANRKRCQLLSRSRRDHVNSSNEIATNKKAGFTNIPDNFDLTKSFDSCQSGFTLKSDSEFSTDLGLGRSTDSFTNSTFSGENIPQHNTSLNSSGRLIPPPVQDTRYNRPVSKHGTLRPNRRSAPNMLQISIDEAEEDDEIARQARPPRPKSAHVRKRRNDTSNNNGDGDRYNSNLVNNNKSSDDDDDDFWSAELVTSDDDDFYSDILSIPDETTQGSTPRGEANVKLGPKFSKVTTTTTTRSGTTNQNEDWWSALTPLENDEVLSGLNSSRTPSTFRSWIDIEDVSGGNSLGKKASERSLSSVILLSPCGEPFDAAVVDNAYPISARSPRIPVSTRNSLPASTTNTNTRNIKNRNNNKKISQHTKSVDNGNKPATNLCNSLHKNPTPNSNPSLSLTEKTIEAENNETKSDISHGVEIEENANENKIHQTIENENNYENKHNTSTIIQKSIISKHQSQPLVNDTTNNNNNENTNSNNTINITSSHPKAHNDTNPVHSEPICPSSPAVQHVSNTIAATNTSECCECFLHANTSTTTITTSPSSTQQCHAEGCWRKTVAELEEHIFTLVLSLTQNPGVSLVDFQKMVIKSRPQFLQALASIPDSNITIATTTMHQNDALGCINTKSVPALESCLAKCLYENRESANPSRMSAFVLRHVSALKALGSDGMREMAKLGGVSENEDFGEMESGSDQDAPLPTREDEIRSSSRVITRIKQANDKTQMINIVDGSNIKIVTGLPPSSSTTSPGRGHAMIHGSKDRSRTALSQRSSNDQGSVVSDSQIGATLVETKNRSPSAKTRPDSGIVVSSSASYSSSSEAAREAEVDVTSQTEWIAKSLEMLQEIYTVQTQDHDSIKALVKAITKNCDSDQLKAHAIYRSAGLRCEKIDGYAKGDNYTPGSPIRSPCNQHSWNAVAFNGHYALMDAKFGALPYKFFVEHYFMTPPDEFRLSHFPKDKKWLLMTQAFSLEDFDATLKTWPTMVAFNIRPLSMKSVLRTYDGRLSITVLLRSVAVTPQLEYAGPGAKLDSESLTLLIDQEIRSVDNAETFHVSLPQEGTYFFTLLVHDIEEDEDIPVFQYRIEYADELL